jgi:hypothetical protein
MADGSHKVSKLGGLGEGLDLQSKWVFAFALARGFFSGWVRSADRDLLNWQCHHDLEERQILSREQRDVERKLVVFEAADEGTFGLLLEDLLALLLELLRKLTPLRLGLALFHYQGTCKRSIL